MTISEIKRRTAETSPHFFDRKTLKFFGQTMRSFSVSKEGENKWLITAPMKDHTGKVMGITKRIFNAETNELEMVK